MIASVGLLFLACGLSAAYALYVEPVYRCDQRSITQTLGEFAYFICTGTTVCFGLSVLIEEIKRIRSRRRLRQIGSQWAKRNRATDRA